MTNEEAIEIINRENDPNDKKVWELFPEYREALDMAINALEQQPCERFEWGIDGNVYKITKAKDGKEICQQVCEDAISREELLKAIDTWDRFGVDDTNSLFRLDNLSLPNYVPYIHYDDVVNSIKGMPPVTPQRKYGKWIVHEKSHGIRYLECSHCNIWYLNEHLIRNSYCPNCGRRMVEPQESEEV